jgi:hypothetical protein
MYTILYIALAVGLIALLERVIKHWKAQKP